MESDRAAHLEPRHERLDGVGLALRQVSVLSWVCVKIEQHCHATAASDNRDRKHELQHVMSWHSLGLVRSGSGGTLPV